MKRVANDSSTAISCEDMRNCFFGNYADSSQAPEERNYAEVVDVPALISTMEGYLVDHNGETDLLLGISACNPSTCASLLLPPFLLTNLGSKLSIRTTLAVCSA